MINEIFEDFVQIEEVNKDLIQKYKNLLPFEIISLWQEYGFGTFKNGYFKVINPDEYKTLLANSYFNGDVSIPIFATAFGDLIIWEDNQFVSIVKYRYNDFDVITDGFEYFNETILDEELADEFYTFEKYDKAIKKYGNLEYDECFGYVPLITMGGKESVNNIKKVKIREHIALITELAGGI